MNIGSNPTAVIKHLRKKGKLSDQEIENYTVEYAKLHPNFHLSEFIRYNCKTGPEVFLKSLPVYILQCYKAKSKIRQTEKEITKCKKNWIFSESAKGKKKIDNYRFNEALNEIIYPFVEKVKAHEKEIRKFYDPKVYSEKYIKQRVRKSIVKHFGYFPKCSKKNTLKIKSKLALKRNLQVVCKQIESCLEFIKREQIREYNRSQMAPLGTFDVKDFSDHKNDTLHPTRKQLYTKRFTKEMNYVTKEDYWVTDDNYTGDTTRFFLDNEEDNSK